MQLSKNEEKLYETLRKRGFKVFKIKDIALLLDNDKIKAYNLIKALKNKKAIDVVSSGVYSFKDTEDFIVGAYFNWPSYVSFLSALNYYGFSDNLPKKITYVSTKYKKHERFEYICLSKKRFFGYKLEGNIIIAEKEKAFVDSLLFSKYSGGIKEISKLLNENFDKLSSDKLIDYASKVNSKMVMRRLGFILEEKLTKKQISFLFSKIGKGYGFLDASIKKTKNLNNKWLLYTDLE